MGLKDKAREAAELKRLQRLQTELQQQRQQGKRPAILQDYDPKTRKWLVKEGDSVYRCTPITNGKLEPGDVVIRKGRLIDAARSTPPDPKKRPKPPAQGLKGAFLFFDSQILSENPAWEKQFLKAIGADRTAQLHNDDRAELNAWFPSTQKLRHTTILKANPTSPLILPLFQPNAIYGDDGEFFSPRLTDEEAGKINQLAQQTAVVLVSDWNAQAAQIKNFWIPHGIAHWAALGYDATAWDFSNKQILEDAPIVYPQFSFSLKTVLLSAACAYKLPELPGVTPLIQHKAETVAVWVKPSAIKPPLRSRTPYNTAYEGSGNA